MDKTLENLLPLIVPFAVGLLTREVAVLGSWAIKKLRSNPKTAPLAAVVEVGEEVVDAGLEGAEAGLSKGDAKGAAQAALTSAGAKLNQDKATLVLAAGGELGALAGTAQKTAVTDGGASVNLP
jgi:hypothetical protein